MASTARPRKGLSFSTGSSHKPTGGGKGTTKRDRYPPTRPNGRAKSRHYLPENAGRNTFISMHVAHYESIDKTALEADNSATIIKKDYLDIVTREDAARYWAIRP
jgi:hypothetical protein